MKSISGRVAHPIRPAFKPEFGKHSKICVVRSIVLPEEAEYADIIDQYIKDAGYPNVDLVDVDKLTCEQQLQDVTSRNYDLIFNVCDGTIMDTKAGFDVCYYLNTKCDIPFVGPSIKGYDPPRDEMKRACLAAGIVTPKHQFVYDLVADLPKLKSMEFPMIVKHFNSAGSCDMTVESKVFNQQQLEQQVKRMIELHRGALVEEFIEGREFTCLLVDNADDISDPYAYEPVQFIFMNKGETFKYRALKYSKESNDLMCVAVDDPDISRKIKEMCKNFFRVLDTESYARYDLRMDSKGQLYMLEVNPIPGMFFPIDFGSADRIVMNTLGGHAEFLHRVMQAAVKRHELRRRSWQIIHELPLGFCCKTLKPFVKNQVIYSLASNNVKLMPISNLSCASIANSQVSDNRFYLPIAGDLVIISQNELDNYKFLQPSVEPNCWLDGLDITARRNIAAGETLTFDYSTLYGDKWQNLIDCSKSKCNNWRSIVQKYDVHVSIFVEKMALQQM